MNLVFGEWNWTYDRTMVSPNKARGSQFPPLATQGSLYNLAFDEVQSQLGNIGKPLNTMNLNELVKNVVSVEESTHQLVQKPSSSSSSSSPPASYFLGNLNLNGSLNKKTIDEVWKEIVHHDHVNNNEVDTNNNQSVQQHLNLGETTLEDFLLRAGVINHQQQPLMAIDPMVVMSQQADWLHFQMHQQQQMTVMDTNYNVSEPVYENPSVVEMGGYSENHHQMGMSMRMTVQAISATPSDSKMAGERKRGYSDEMMEKTIERRQKRMIKNRESAARSRARKQAYTNQLEVEVFELRKTNSWLKKQKEVEMLFTPYPNPVPKYQLRRTSSV